jgi:hypothetical protein
LVVASEILVPGQFVAVRRRHFVVADVKISVLAAHPLDPFSALAEHLDSLSRIEDDRQGEALDGIWEIESEAAVPLRAQLPDASGFDDRIRLDVFLDTVRWGAFSAITKSREGNEGKIS